MAPFAQYKVSAANANLEKSESPIPEPERGYVRIKVKACGVCHSDSFTVTGGFPGIQFPRAPGHEIAGVIDAVGPDVHPWQAGDRVGVGWYGGHCGHCKTCRYGDFVVCDEMPVAGIHYDGGYGEYVMARAEALAKIPDKLSFVEAAPLLCAGVTTFHGIRRNAPPAGSVVAVQGIGGLGHLAIQFANKMGYEVVVLSRGSEKKELAMKLGAHHYFDTQSQDVAAECAKLGGVRLLVATTTSPKAMEKAVPTLGKEGKLVILGAGMETVDVEPLFLIQGQRAVQGHASGSSADSEDTMKFAALTGVRSMNEVYPAEKTAEAYERMMSGKASFRVVIDWENKA